ncbi:flagellar rod assembly protein/muramidase FlgJ [Yersinia pestis]|nr:flagellar rod assembly protein/muramidase FlgJ [Yersinia pestis]
MIEAINKSSPVIPGSFVGDLQPQDLEQAAVLAADDDPFNSKQQRMMRDFYDDKLASTLASQRSSGIANLLIQQLGSK